MAELETNYNDYYSQRVSDHVYPVEFVVRAFLGTYPRLKASPADLIGQSVLDLGFGDGRNMPLLTNLGMRVHGVEITNEICAQAAARMAKHGIDVDLRVGRNASIPYPDRYFDNVLACHACYYVDQGTSFADNLREIARVTKPGGRFVFSAPISTGYIVRGAKDLGDRHMLIAEDPYGVRNGYILKAFDDENALEAELSPQFEDLRIGACRNDFWGIEEHVWTVVCRRSKDA